MDPRTDRGALSPDLLFRRGWNCMDQTDLSA